MANDKPVTRKERFLAGAAGEDITLDAPITREERFLAKAAGMDVKTDDPVTRSEKYLAKIAEGGGGGGSVPEYEGAYTVTPSEQTQTLATDGKKCTDDITVNPISSTYIGSGVTQKAAATYTPTTSDQTIAANQYLAGAQTVAGDANLVAGNIKKDVQLFGVTGSYEGGGITPSGTISITQNGQVDVTQYATADVNVSGGGTVEAPLKDVNFYDYDGTRLYSYTAPEFLALTEMPANPTHSGLTAQGWNWTLADAKTVVSDIGGLDIGQIYITDDGKTRIYITLDGALSPYCGFGINGTAIIDWGDGSTRTVRGTNTNTVINTLHNYASAGSYVITISVDGEMMFGEVSNFVVASAILSAGPSSDANSCKVYSYAIDKVELGSNCILGEGAFEYCGLSTITIPYNISMSGGYQFYYALALKHINLPSTMRIIKKQQFRYCGSLKTISFPAETGFGYASPSSYSPQTEMFAFSPIVSIAMDNSYAEPNIPQEINLDVKLSYNNANTLYYPPTLRQAKLRTAGTFSKQYTLKTVILGSLATSIAQSAFEGCSALSLVVIPSSVTTIGSKAFESCYGLSEIHFKSSTPPTFNGSDIWTNTPSTKKIYVPTGSLSAYQNATNAPTGTYIEE